MNKKNNIKTEYSLKDHYNGPLIATDIVIRYQDGIVLIDRVYEPHGISLPGGMAERMPFPDNAIKEAKEETGLDVILDDRDRPLCVLSELDQDPREFVASVTYVGTGYGILKPKIGEDAKSAIVMPYDDLPRAIKETEWAFSHHPRIIEKFMGVYLI